MAFVPEKKATLLIPSGSQPGQLHLYVLLTNSCKNSFNLLVNFTSIKEGCFYDNACIIQAGEHPFITKNSYIFYQGTRQDRSDHLIKCVEGWLFKPHDPLSDDLFDRVCAGIEKTKFISRGMRQYFRDQN